MNIKFSRSSFQPVMDWHMHMILYSFVNWWHDLHGACACMLLILTCITTYSNNGTIFSGGQRIGKTFEFIHWSASQHFELDSCFAFSALEFVQFNCISSTGLLLLSNKIVQIVQFQSELMRKSKKSPFRRSLVYVRNYTYIWIHYEYYWITDIKKKEQKHKHLMW